MRELVWTAVVTWLDGSQTTMRVIQFRKVEDLHYRAQFPDGDWEDIEGCISIVWRD